MTDIKLNKAAAGDNVQGEFLANLGVAEKLKFLELFNEPLQGGARPLSWECLHVILLAKMPKATWIQHFRPITITFALGKTHDRMLLQKVV